MTHCGGAGETTYGKRNQPVYGETRPDGAGFGSRCQRSDHASMVTLASFLRLVNLTIAKALRPRKTMAVTPHTT